MRQNITSTKTACYITPTMDDHLILQYRIRTVSVTSNKVSTFVIM